MVSFRKCILALTMLALFVGLASAQVTGTNQLTCSSNVSVTPTLRAEGYTEQTGDITLTCQGGTALAPGAQIPAVNIQIFLNTNVTSRLLPVSTTGGVGGAANASEALLLIDEPGSGLAGYGPSLAQKVCQTPGTGCTQWVGTQAGVTLGTAVDACVPPVTGGSCTTTSTVFGANVFQGVVSGNSVTFFGIPVLPPVTSGAARVFRITNIRANASQLSGGLAGSQSVIAGISVSGATSLLITNPSATVGFVAPGLNPAGTATSTNFTQCTSVTRASASQLVFTEGFGTAFKTRVAAASNGQFAGQIGNPAQNVPGTIYNSESNFVLSLGSQGTAGLADYGTRLKATFANVRGVRLFVSATNVNNNAVAVTAPSPIGGSAGNTAANAPYALLVQSETGSDGSPGSAGNFPQVIPGTDVPSTGNAPIVEIPVAADGTATAVWEIVNTNPNSLESIRFGVYTTYVANVAQNSPAPTLTTPSTVSLSFAPTPSAAFTASNGPIPQTALYPRFISDSVAPRPFLTVNICRTILLYPFVTSVTGFDTGLAIANTSSDPVGTGAQSGTCTLNWYQGTNNPPPTPIASIASGTVWANTTGILLGPGSNFNGYMIAVCNFQFAHGYAFISDVGARNIAEGYLALVIPDRGTGNRAASGLDKADAGTGENVAH